VRFFIAIAATNVMRLKSLPVKKTSFVLLRQNSSDLQTL